MADAVASRSSVLERRHGDRCDRRDDANARLALARARAVGSDARRRRVRRALGGRATRRRLGKVTLFTHTLFFMWVFSNECATHRLKLFASHDDDDDDDERTTRWTARNKIQRR
jgi:hypothetical protein